MVTQPQSPPELLIMSLATDKSCVWVKGRPNILSDAKIDLLKISQKDSNRIKETIFFKVFNSNK